MNTIVSKRTTPFTYQEWKFVNGQFIQDGPGIVINGGSGIVGGLELLSGRPLNQRNSIIPIGVHTYVDDDVLEKLYRIPKFNRDIERGLIAVIKGQRCTQDETDSIADRDLIDNEHIPTRPITDEEFKAAGATLNSDGSVNIGNMATGDSPMRQRKIEAGLPSYAKKDIRENKRRDSEERKRAYRKRK